MDTDQQNDEFWSSLVESLMESSEPKDDLYPEICFPMVMPTTMNVDVMPEPWKELEGGGKEVVPEKEIVVGGNQNTNESFEKFIEKHIVVYGSNNFDKVREKTTEKEIILGGSLNINEGKKVDENAKKTSKTLGKRPRRYARNIVEKKRRAEIKNNIDKLKLLTRCNPKQKDLYSTLEQIVDRIREMKLYVESYSMGPMFPLGMGMNFPAPWVIPPHFMPFITPGGTNSHSHNDQVPFTTKGTQ